MTCARRFASMLAVAAVAVCALAGGAAVAPARLANTTFDDPAGDGVPGMPDITTVAVSDRADGMVTIDATVVGDLAASGTEIEIFIDIDKATDRDAPETSPFNAEYYIYWRPAGGSGDWDLKHWAKGGWWSVFPELAEYEAAGSHHIFRFHRAEIGDPAGFSFLVFVPSADVAPSTGKWLYNLGPQVVTPAFGSPAAAPSAPIAGKRFTLTIPCSRAETHRPLETATVTVTATLAGAHLPPLTRYVASQAWLRVTIPKSAAGKLLTIRVTAVSPTKTTATKTFSYRVRRA